MIEYEEEFNLSLKGPVTYKNVNLASFLSLCKTNYNEDKLSSERLELLEKTRTFSKWLNREIPEIIYSFEEKVNLILDYEKESGKLLSGCYIYNNVKLGSFFNDCKKNYNKSKLTLEKIELLKTTRTFSEWLKINKPPKSEIIYTFEEKVNLMIGFEEEFNLKVVKTTKYKNFNVGSFFAHCKSSFKKLTPERLELLEKTITFSEWLKSEKPEKPEIVYSFEEKVQLILDYERINNTNLAYNTIYENVRLGNFIGTCKKEYKKNKLSLDKLELLKMSNTFNEWLKK